MLDSRALPRAGDLRGACLDLLQPTPCRLRRLCRPSTEAKDWDQVLPDVPGAETIVHRSEADVFWSLPRRFAFWVSPDA